MRMIKQHELEALRLRYPAGTRCGLNVIYGIDLVRKVVE